MTTDNSETEVDETETAETEGTETEETEGTEAAESEKDEKVARSELTKAIARRDKAIEAARRMKVELDAVKAKESGEAEPSEADKLRTGLMRTASRTVLAGVGVTEKADQAKLLEWLRLDDAVELDDSGEADTDALEERVTELRRIFGGPSKPEPRRPRVDTRDRGGRDSSTSDPDSGRYRAFITGSRN